MCESKRREGGGLCIFYMGCIYMNSRHQNLSKTTSRVQITPYSITKVWLVNYGWGGYILHSLRVSTPKFMFLTDLTVTLTGRNLLRAPITGFHKSIL